MKHFFFLFAAILLAAVVSEPACAADWKDSYQSAADRAVGALEEVLDKENDVVYVYCDYSDTQNHFTQKAKIYGTNGGLFEDLDENWQDNPYSGSSCMRCAQKVLMDDWGGWLFLNGYIPEGSTSPELNKGDMDGQGMDLRGADALTFYARGEQGGEVVEFYTCGFGYDGAVKALRYPDSSSKVSLGRVKLEKEWQEYRIDLSEVDTSYVVCGFGYVVSGSEAVAKDTVFYLDEVCYTGDFSKSTTRDCLIRSYVTDQMEITNAAFTYDNALAAMAFLSSGKQEKAEQILNSFVYAVENDRYKAGRIRNAYASGDIASFPGWGLPARLPGWYEFSEDGTGTWYEDRYQTGSNVGNTSYAALALLQYDAMYGNEKYVRTAAALKDWVISECGGNGIGFTGGYDGWPENGTDTTYVFTYKSIEHNIDAWAAFARLYKVTGEQKYKEAAVSAYEFILSMYEEDPGVFLTGTGDDGVTPSRENIVLDAQVWACLAMEALFDPYLPALDIVEQMKTEEGAYPFCLENENGGWWSEGTAYTALMYHQLAAREDLPEDLRKKAEAAAEEAMNALLSVQLESGMLPAASNDHLSTGFELFDGSPWEYGTSPHIAPTAWLVMAANNFNPYAFS